MATAKKEVKLTQAEKDEKVRKNPQTRMYQKMMRGFLRK